MDPIEQGQKKVYTTPALTIYGGIEVITQGNSGGGVTDASFPAGTSLKDITTT
jgi:hypothetical protein